MGNSLPLHVVLHEGTYRYRRRPPKGVEGKAFVRSFGTKNLKEVHVQYGAVHREAEQHFARKQAGLSLPDPDLKMLGAALLLTTTAYPENRPFDGRLETAEAFKARMLSAVPGIAQLPEADLRTIVRTALKLYLHEEADRIVTPRDQIKVHETALLPLVEAKTQSKLVKDQFTLRDAFEQAWKPAKTRGKNTEVEVGRYVDEFVTLNGLLPLRDYTREHWAKWRANCLEKHGPGMTAFKRFSMMKTLVAESIRAGLFERKHFEGQDVTMRKLKGNRLRNEGWLQDELTEFFGAPVFRGAKDMPHADADYWVAVIIAYTGARLSEITGMLTTDVAERHGFWTFFLAKEAGKTEDSRRGGLENLDSSVSGVSA
jgi:hypothetical protein